ncbi:MAG: hypothetical protein NT069_15905 [Planctomycetota bacterium]|nr:hypothetical protein [Planctomycetota bacterium]
MTDRPHHHAWREVLALNIGREVVSGSPDALRRSIASGADLRIYSEFYHDEHIEPNSGRHELVQESMDMRTTYLVDERWAAGVITLRQPVELPDRFGPRPSLSLFLYNEDGQQAIARPMLDGPPARGVQGASPPRDHSEMPGYHELDRFDDGTNAPSSNFIYDFNRLKYFVREEWREVLSHSAEGEVLAGSIDAVAQAFRAGAEFKIGIRGLCDDLAIPGDAPLNHEVFVQLGSCYYYTSERCLVGSSHPVARVRPAVPMRYGSSGWDYAWLLPRTDGKCALLIYDPYTLKPRRTFERFAMRWFCR